MPKPEKLHSDTGTSVEGRPRHPRSHYCTVQWMYHCFYIDYCRSKGCLPRSFPRRSHHVPAHAVSAPFSHPTMMDSTTGALLCCCSITPILCATIYSSFLYFFFSVPLLHTLFISLQTVTVVVLSNIFILVSIVSALLQHSCQLLYNFLHTWSLVWITRPTRLHCLA